MVSTELKVNFHGLVIMKQIAGLELEGFISRFYRFSGKQFSFLKSCNFFFENTILYQIYL